MLGLSFEGVEQMAWELFVELEKRALINQGEGIAREREEG